MFIESISFYSIIKLTSHPPLSLFKLEVNNGISIIIRTCVSTKYLLPHSTPATPREEMYTFPFPTTSSFPGFVEEVGKCSNRDLA